jgi:hypothetical protein
MLKLYWLILTNSMKLLIFVLLMALIQNQTFMIYLYLRVNIDVGFYIELWLKCILKSINCFPSLVNFAK